jgi:adenylylsulfate kinase-like enzyme
MAPEHLQRDLVARILGDKLMWFYIHAPLDICMARDPKGLYKRALEGQVKQLINYPFEVPRPQERDYYINTIALSVDECYQEILEAVKSRLSDYVI